MDKYAIVCRDDESSYRLKDIISKQLNEVLVYDEEKPDLVIVIGGDGTILSSIHQYIDQLETTCFIGLHTGTLGFFTDYQKEDYQLLINDILTKEGTISSKYLLKVKFAQQESYALNEVRVENNMRSLVLDVYIDGNHLETFRGNGLCISTDSGSTAYNMSLGGAVVYPDMKVMQLSEIAGIHHNAYRSLNASLILGEDHKICIHSLDFSHAVLGVDDRVYKLSDINQLEIGISDKSVHFIQYHSLSFIDRIKRAFIK